MASLLELLFCFIFLSYTEIIISHGKGSCSSSCGSLQSIRYPFHLRGDPAECGSSNFELSCEGNNTILDIHQRKYYVKDISYRDYKITLVDVGLSHDNCSLLGGSIYPGDLSETFWSELYYQGQATFINCLVKLNDSSSEILPCLNKNNTTVYVTFISFYVGYFPENCQFLYTIPVTENDGLSRFDQFKLGFRLNWHPPINSATDAIYICAKTTGLTKFFERESSNVFNGVKVMTTYGVISPFQFEFDFLACLHEKRYHQSILTFYVAALIIIVLDISLLILGRNIVVIDRKISICTVMCSFIPCIQVIQAY
ncbi:hypothetical protein M5K25_027750 [Dendrobium thyrsiflorum]|uniref:RING-type E3 ubiquitin transferase n=1 Tax=Dendrobium thyrsiflorum TaxID=117978 RepID=A0ABD0TUL9_DENTH